MVFTHMGIIYKICKLYAAEEDRDDLKQEIIYQLWKSYPTYRGDSKFQSWMYRVALNTAMLGLRARKIKYTILSDQTLEISEDPFEHQDQAERMERSKRKYLWLWIAVFLLLTVSMVFGILAAIR